MIPCASGARPVIPMRPGPAGFVLAVLVLWWHEVIEPINRGQTDDWGYAKRPIRGSTTVYSNHASGTAVDVNATQHPMGVPAYRTFTPAQIGRIRRRMKATRGVVRWGGDWSRPDGMHLEIGRGSTATRAYASAIRWTDRGKRVAAANRDPLNVRRRG